MGRMVSVISQLETSTCDAAGRYFIVVRDFVKFMSQLSPSLFLLLLNALCCHFLVLSKHLNGLCFVQNRKYRYVESVN